jgi:hypothetical protein
MRTAGTIAATIGALLMLVGVVLALSGLAEGRTLAGMLAQNSGIGLVWTGGGAVLAGFALRGLDDLLAELRGLRADMGRQSSGTAPAQRTTYIHAPAPPDWKKPARAALPTRFALQQRYGEPTGNRAWALMDAAQRAGTPIDEAEAARQAREEAGAPHR